MANKVRVYGNIDKDLFDFIESKIEDDTFSGWTHALKVIIKKYKENEGEDGD